MELLANEWTQFVAAPSQGLQGLHAHFNKHRYERHSHDYFVIGTMDVGASKVGLGSGSIIAPAGSAMIVNPGDAHDGSVYSEQGYTYSMLYVQPWVVDGMAHELELNPGHGLCFTRPVLSDPDIVAGLQTLHRTLFQQQDSLALEVTLIDALKPLLSRYSTRRFTPQEECHEPRIARVRDLIHASFASPLTTEDMAQASGLSRVRLNQLFRAAYGLSLHAYLNRVRMDSARQMLRAGLPAADVASAVGLFDQSHLIRRFKGCFGITPAQFVSAHFSDIQYGRR